MCLIRKLSHATKVVIASRTFLHRMIDMSMSAKSMHHHIKLNIHSDLAWWESFLPNWNCRSFMCIHTSKWDPQVLFSSDASGSWGCGAIWSTQWIQCEWNGVWLDKSIALKDLLPIALALALWGKFWSHKQVQVFCDNAVVIEIINAKTSKCEDIMHLIRCLHSIL